MRHHTLTQIENLLQHGRVSVVRNRRNLITEAHYRQADGASSLPDTFRGGTKYVHEEHLRSGHTVWQHNWLPRTGSSADLFVRAAFRAVPLSVLQRAA